MSKASYDEIPAKLRDQEDFMGSACRGTHVSAVDQGDAPDSDFDTITGILKRHGSAYVVFSYHTPIAIVSKDGSDKFVSDHFYSSTTSRIQNLCRENL